MPRTFCVDVDTDVFLSRVADALLYRLQLFGRWNATFRNSPEVIDHYTATQAVRVGRVLKAMEEHAGLRFQPLARIPYCYNTYTWPDGLPLAGHVASDAAPAPDLLVNSMAMAWHVGVTTKALESRLLTAALNVAGHHGTEAGLDIMLDLYQHGWVVDQDQLCRAVNRYVIAASRVASPDELITFFYPGDRPQDMPKLMEVELRLGRSRRRTTMGKGVGGEQLLNRLVQRCLDFVAKMRQASSLDVWYDGQVQLETLGTVVASAWALLPRPSHITLGPVLSQIEEIRCDALAIAHHRPPSGRFTMRYAEIIMKYGGHMSEEAAQRRYEERLLMPAELYPLMEVDRPPLPEQWRHLSWIAVHPWAAATRYPGSIGLVRMPAHTPEELAATPSVRDLLERHGVTSGGHAATVATLLDPPPLADDFHRRNHLLAEDFEASLPQAHDQLAAQEIVSADHTARRHAGRGDHHRAAEVWAELERHYPYDTMAAAERASLPETAVAAASGLESLFRVLVLHPDRAEHWMAAAELLDRTANDAESMAARDIAQDLLRN